jgi:arylsulfatase A-like enzyme
MRCRRFFRHLGLPAAQHRLEGRSLIPLLHGENPDWRRYAISEYDYAFQAPARERLGQPIDRCRMTMVRSERWKYLAYDGFRPQLFDLLNDPQELRDLGMTRRSRRCARSMRGICLSGCGV